ncbi:hypothetical protein AURDEDRAFT_112697 [Auricularia subglabra TFB-10046 SS5]|nr:hypothetical protein AURDEDRAFT_112697 [Auricularia subglabra TFB-10046 SS5]
MFSSLVGQRASITLQPYEKLLYLHPTTEIERRASSSSSVPTSEHTCGGNVTLSLPKPREITSLVVKLVTYYTMNIPEHASESGILEEYSAQLGVPHKLDKGEHAYSWSLTIPRDSAPYERCAYGRVYHRLQAVAEGPAGTVKTEIPLEIIINPAPEGDMFGLDETVQGFNQEVGPYRMNLSSEQLTVGGAVHFTLHLASLPADTNIYSVSAHVKQSYTLTSPLRSQLTCTPAPHERQIFLLDHRTVLLLPGTPPSAGPPTERGHSMIPPP